LLFAVCCGVISKNDQSFLDFQSHLSNRQQLWRAKDEKNPWRQATEQSKICSFVYLGPLKRRRVITFLSTIIIMMGITITIPPGALSVLVVEPSRDKGGCVIVETQNHVKQSPKLRVNDIIVSVNDIDFVGMSKMEGGEKAWIHLLFQHNVERRLVVLRESGEKSKGEDIDGLPLKNISNMRRCNFEVVDNRVAVEHQSCGADASKTSSKEVKWKDQRLLQKVVDNWTRGVGNRQSVKCVSAIQSCLLYDICPNDIARHVGDATNEQEHKGLESAQSVLDGQWRSSERNNRPSCLLELQPLGQQVNPIVKLLHADLQSMDVFSLEYPHSR
jgi:hypothetical protein